MSKREHRRFTAEQKIEILGKAEQPGVTVSEVCRRHSLAPSVLYRWRAVEQNGSAAALKRGRAAGASPGRCGSPAGGRAGAAEVRDRGDHGREPGAEKKDLRLDDLSRIPAESKAAVMQIVVQTKRRSGWPAQRTLPALGVPRSVYSANPGFTCY
jgi:transposase-like protein